MKDILSGKKLVFQNNQVLPVNAPRFKELTVSRISVMVKNEPKILRYLPSDIETDRLPRSYFFTVSYNSDDDSLCFKQIINTVVP